MATTNTRNTKGTTNIGEIIRVIKAYENYTTEQCRDLIHVPTFFDNAEDQQNDGCQENKQDCFFSAAKSWKGIQIRDVLSGLVEFVHWRKLRVLFNLGRV